MIRLSRFTFKNKVDVRNKYQHQIILIFDQLKIQTTKFKKEFFIYDRILKVNKIDETYFKYRKIIIQDRTAFREIKLNKCYKKSFILWQKVMNIKWHRFIIEIHSRITQLFNMQSLWYNKNKQTAETLLLLIKHDQNR